MYIVPLALLCVAALGFILYPYYKTKLQTLKEAPDIGVYKAQLKELESDIERGILDENEAVKSRTEIERRILKAASQEKEETKLETPKPILVAAIAVIILSSGLLYSLLGTPTMPDFPKNSDGLSSLNETETQELQKNKDLIRQVKAKLVELPEDPRGWAYLANLEMSIGNFQGASEALYNAQKLAPDQFDFMLMYAESLIMASNERVTPAALLVLNKAAALDPTHPGTKYYLALAEFQAGEIETAHNEWVEIREGLNKENPLYALVDFWIGKAEVELGLATALPETRMPSISQEQAEIIQNMNADEQQELIRQMVMQLADKMEQNPTNIEGWLRLSQAYTVLGQKEDAIKAIESAIENAPNNQKFILEKELEKLTNME